MATDVKNLVSAIKSYGLSRPNMFIFEIPDARLTQPNQGQSANNYIQPQTNMAERLSMQCEVTSFPGRAIVTNDIRTYGPVTKIPHSTVYDDLVVSFRVGKDMMERVFFDSWMNSVSLRTDLSNGSYNNFNFLNIYTKKITIKQYSPEKDEDVITYGVNFIGAYPTQISELPLNNEELNTYHKLTVKFAYRYYEAAYDSIYKV